MAVAVDPDGYENVLEAAVPRALPGRDVRGKGADMGRGRVGRRRLATDGISDEQGLDGAHQHRHAGVGILGDRDRLTLRYSAAVHEHERLLRDVYAAMAAGDGRALARVLTPETAWVIPGRSKLAGVYRGPDEIFGFWKEVARQTGGGLRLELRDALANDERGVALVTARGRRDGRELDARQVAVFEFGSGGTIVSATFIYEDPDTYEAFWAS